MLSKIIGAAALASFLFTLSAPIVAYADRCCAEDQGRM